MTTRIVGGTVTAANGQTLSSVPIDIELVLAEAFVVTGSLSLAGKLQIQTGPDGTWSTLLQCNDDLTPVGTLYQVTEKIPGGNGGAKVYLIQVLTGLPVSPAVNQVLNLIVPQAVPVGGTYAPVGSGPQGIQGPQGPPGSIPVADNAALNALTPKTLGLPIWVIATKCLYAWDGTQYNTLNIPTFASTAAANAGLAAHQAGQPYYLQTNLATEGPMWRNTNDSHTKPWNMPWGIIAISYGAVAGGSLSTTPFNVLALMSTPLKMRRQYLLTLYLRAVSSVSNTAIRVTLSGITPPALLAGTTLGLDHYVNVVGGILGSVNFGMPFTVGGDGNFNLAPAVAVQSGTGSFWTDAGGHVRVEDLGPTGAPV